jgi:cytochrome c oxidase subunit 2
VHNVYVPIALGVWVVFTLVVILAVVRYRRGRGHEASRREERSKLEGGYAVVLTLVAAFLVYLTLHVEGREDPVSAKPGLKVHVVASRWQWRFEYPDLGIVVEPSRGSTVLTVPVDTTVAFTGTSLDVIHSFWVPRRRYKHDVFPNGETTWDLRWPRTGWDDSGECGEFCGLDHASMRFTVHVVAQDAFRRWVAARA